ncbi:hypothetical protein [Desulfotalea psychrophila]|uniref:Uncharacterized protein n=1 Tax=Desulfotalea psychrophila (strain LSv54 / DSM 12343) TaxID=177439 RepID=Q6ANC5_DESPS|nr:hypothetical protein [Desulfotalea psychrophila]CAG36149.1 unknown protein [Desulfotalea psychrophila LSv54]
MPKESRALTGPLSGYYEAKGCPNHEHSVEVLLVGVPPRESICTPFCTPSILALIPSYNNPKPILIRKRDKRFFKGGMGWEWAVFCAFPAPSALKTKKDLQQKL